MPCSTWVLAAPFGGDRACSHADQDRRLAVEIVGVLARGTRLLDDADVYTPRLQRDVQRGDRERETR